MSTVTWGLLDKSGVDDETVEEAINRLIAVHEADPTAHLGVGEALEAHKNADVIDHPAGSVLADKSTTKEVVISHNFVPLTYYDVIGVGTYEAHQEWVAGIMLYIEESGSSLAVSSLLPFSLDIPSATQDSLFQFNAQVVDGAVFEGYFGFFSRPSTTITAGFGFKFLNTNVYPFFVTSSGLVVGDSIGINLTEVHQYRALYDASLKKVSFYVDGTLAEEIISSSTVPGNDGTRAFFLCLSNGASTFISINVYDWLFSLTI